MTAIDRFVGEYEFLSNFYTSPIKLEDDTVYVTVEHAYQAAKATTEEDRAKVQHAGTPGQAKRMGRKIDLREDWEEVKVNTMRDLLRMKFDDPDLRDKLVATSPQPLVEGNTWGDTFWGVDTRKGGSNRLGQLLMLLRSELQVELAIGEIFGRLHNTKLTPDMLRAAQVGVIAKLKQLQEQGVLPDDIDMHHVDVEGDELGRVNIEMPWYLRVYLSEGEYFRVPHFKHDHCGDCVFLAHADGKDHYYCPQESLSLPTVISRYSDEPSGYLSGLGLEAPDGISEDLGVAYHLAVEKGLVKARVVYH